MSDQLKNQDAIAEGFTQPLYVPIKRRSFFMYAGATAGATALVLAGCSKDDETTPNTGGTAGTGANVSLGSGDVGVLNYAYALEQLEAAFYKQVVDTPASDFKAGELDYFKQVAAHEAIHRDFLKAALTNVAKVTPIPGLNPDFSTIKFNSRDSVLGTAKAFEDLGVAAYNGAGRLLKNATYLGLAGKIVSVEARHAAYVRDLISAGSFSSDVDANGLDSAMMPTDVLAIAGKYIKEKLDGSSIGK
jgi:hypothetical protein